MLGPQGLGKHGSGGGVLASILEQPVMVSGWGSNPGRQVHTGLPCLLGLHSVLGPQGLGSHGSGLGAHLECQASCCDMCHVSCLMSPVVVTNVPCSTVPVQLTLPLTPGDGVWHRDKAGEAATHGVTLRRQIRISILDEML